ncbi:MAG: hypothetical protein DRP85_00900 [Candidatus Makaraimicrobium thalassicum]|nr:MAG: hypothetical protein DRP85_00900 [Candidatus Omnitrophota bacterium]
MTKKQSKQPDSDWVCKPLLGWVGSKRRLLPVLLKYTPHRKYLCEAFAGSAALYFGSTFKRAFLNDVDLYLIRFYDALRKYPEQIIERFKQLSDKIDKDSYLKSRENNFLHLENKQKIIDFAAHFWYWNKLAFSSVMHFNKKGFFSVPYRPRKTPLKVNIEQINIIVKKLRNAKLYNKDFREFLSSFLKCNALDRIVFYIDPPYIKTHASYADKWTNKDIEDLVKICTELKNKGAFLLISGNKITADAFVEAGWKIEEIFKLWHCCNPARNMNLKEEFILSSR